MKGILVTWLIVTRQRDGQRLFHAPTLTNIHTIKVIGITRPLSRKNLNTRTFNIESKTSTQIRENDVSNI